ncbi:MAG: hypothetical protein A2Y62_00050 [Candidatus Fischerbacteria bacterium RBG_13_37_8]|uniref:Mutual gliding-motility protein MglA n=1 Tax=Candidatus Fischerbacteria bacterium RBG_13_37_8 TaxID=1817863 RepID=A0A1F5V7G0_9BACT|nr:MAG: hypothetical protein A2Y62_00050 [Candidatus Fischerbacteria bacterium RBG_13_37_8]
MAFVNFNAKEITAKIVYYGPGLGGKTSSLQYIYNNLPEENRGKMISLATDEDRTIYFDFLPLHLGKIQNFTVKVQLYTVPGQVRYNATRKLVLKGVDGIVFVADSQIHRKFSNIESYNNLEENLLSYQKELKEIAHSIQYNKIDLPNIINSEELNQLINKYGAPYFQTCAITGIGIMDSLKSISKKVFAELTRKGITSKTYLVEKPAVLEEEQLKLEPDQEKDSLFASEENPDEKIAEPPLENEYSGQTEIEELSSEDVEIVGEDLGVIEPNYVRSAVIEEESVFEEGNVANEPYDSEIHEIQPGEVVVEEFKSDSHEIEFSPEHFQIIDEDEAKEPSINEKVSDSSSFEELEDFSPFAQLEPETKLQTHEEDAFTDFLDEAIPTEESSVISPENLNEESNVEVIQEADVLEHDSALEFPDEDEVQDVPAGLFLEEELIDDDNLMKGIEEPPANKIAESESEARNIDTPLSLKVEKEEKEILHEEFIEDHQPEGDEIVPEEIPFIKESLLQYEVAKDIVSEEIVEEIEEPQSVSATTDDAAPLPDTFEKEASQEFTPPREELGVSFSNKEELQQQEQSADESSSINKEAEQELYEVSSEEKIMTTLPNTTFSYSTFLNSSEIKAAFKLFEEAFTANDNVSIATHAISLLNSLMEKLDDKLHYLDSKSITEKLLLCGVSPQDYYLFRKRVHALQQDMKCTSLDLHFIHYFLIGLYIKIQYL